MFNEFKAFINRGNVIDLAVAVIIGGAFGKITTSVTEDVIMPVIGWLAGGLDFSSHFVRLGDIPPGYRGSPTDYAALKDAGVAMIGYGELLTVLINFLLIALVVFLLVRAVNRALEGFAAEQAAKEAKAPDSTEVLLLREIRDELRTGRPVRFDGPPPM